MKPNYLEILGLISGCLAWTESPGPHGHSSSDSKVSSRVRSAHFWFYNNWGSQNTMNQFFYKRKPDLWKKYAHHRTKEITAFLSLPPLCSYLIFPLTPSSSPSLSSSFLLSSPNLRPQVSSTKMFVFLSVHRASLLVSGEVSKVSDAHIGTPRNAVWGNTHSNLMRPSQEYRQDGGPRLINTATVRGQWGWAQLCRGLR